MQVKLSNGEATVKEFVTRKLKKEINRAMFQGVDSEMEVDASNNGGNKQSMKGFNVVNMDAANDIALLGMVEKITINGEDKPITQSTFDDMNSDDANTIIDAINEISKKK